MQCRASSDTSGEGNAVVARLAEREKQWETLNDLLASARRGRGRVAVISGPIAAGKTTLLEHFTEQAIADGALVLEAAGSRAERYLPFGILTRILDSIAPWSPASTPSPPPCSTASAPRRRTPRTWQPEPPAASRPGCGSSRTSALRSCGSPATAPSSSPSTTSTTATNSPARSCCASPEGSGRPASSSSSPRPYGCCPPSLPSTPNSSASPTAPASGCPCSARTEPDACWPATSPLPPPSGSPPTARRPPAETRYSSRHCWRTASRPWATASPSSRSSPPRPSSAPCWTASTGATPRCWPSPAASPSSATPARPLAQPHHRRPRQDRRTGRPGPGPLRNPARRRLP